MQRFAPFYLKIGLPYGVLIGIGTSLSYWFAWYDFLFTTVVCALLFGGALWLVAEPFVRWIRPTLLSKIAVGIGLVIVAIPVGDSVFLLVRELPHGTFRPLPDPPERAVAMIVQPCSSWRNPRAGKLFVVDSTGRRYRFVDSDPRDEYWEPLSSSEGIALIPPDSCPYGGVRRQYATPPVLGRVVARAQIVEDHVDAGSHTHYLLMADGTIREWSNGDSAMLGVFTALIMACVSLVLGILALPLTVRLWRERPE